MNEKYDERPNLKPIQPKKSMLKANLKPKVEQK
jgi:hypothetical protein